MSPYKIFCKEINWYEVEPPVEIENVILSRKSRLLEIKRCRELGFIPGVKVSGIQYKNVFPKANIPIGLINRFNLKEENTTENKWRPLLVSFGEHIPISFSPNELSILDKENYE